jgi:peroxiredoxin
LSTKTARNQRGKKGPVSPKKIAPAETLPVPQKTATPPRKRYQRKRYRLNVGVIAFFAVVVGVAIIALGVIFFLNNQGGSSAGTGQAGQYAFQVGSPGPGATAPEIKLPATDGSTFDLAAMRGKTMLLYFQEGLTCQPCWDQLKDIQSNINQFQALGIDQVVSITTDPLNALQQKVADEGLTLPVLSDPSLAVSSAYTANGYGMMGASRDGHTFIVVGPDGLIKWRADYGGAPKYTMYVPVPNLVADIRAGLNGKTS